MRVGSLLSPFFVQRDYFLLFGMFLRLTTQRICPSAVRLIQCSSILLVFGFCANSCRSAIFDTTKFSGTVPFTCSLLNGDQTVEMGYTALGIMKPGFALLSGSSSAITASANGLARVSVQLENVATASPDAMQMHVRAPQLRNQSVANPNESNNHTDALDLEAPLQLKLELQATVVDQPDEYEIKAVITCFQP